MKKCSNPNCAHEFSDDMAFCPYCGTKWIPSKRKCPHCEFDDIPDDAKYCPNCGLTLDKEMKSKADLRKVTICGDTTWYAIKQPDIKIFMNNIQVGAVPYKGKICLTLKKEKVNLRFKPWGGIFVPKTECVIPEYFNGEIQLTTNRLTGKISALLIDDKVLLNSLESK